MDPHCKYPDRELRLGEEVGREEGREEEVDEEKMEEEQQDYEGGQMETHTVNTHTWADCQGHTHIQSHTHSTCSSCACFCSDVTQVR